MAGVQGLQGGEAMTEGDDIPPCFGKASIELGARALAHARVVRNLEQEGRKEDNFFIARAVDAGWRQFEQDARTVLASTGLLDDQP
jgi:hypothetical protein